MDQPTRALVDRLKSDDVIARGQAARELAERDPPPAGLVRALVDVVERLGADKEKHQKWHRLEVEYQVFRVLARCAGDPALERELPRLAPRLLEIAGDWTAHDSDTPVPARAADLLAFFLMPAALVPPLAAVLGREHLGLDVAERVVEALSRAGGPVAERAIAALLEHERTTPHPIWKLEELTAAHERARGRRK